MKVLLSHERALTRARQDATPVMQRPCQDATHPGFDAPVSGLTHASQSQRTESSTMRR